MVPNAGPKGPKWRGRLRRLIPSASWPESWQRSYSYDLLEIYGSATDLGYSYAYAHRRAETLCLIGTLVQPPAQILDVAAAQGNFSLLLAEQGYHVTWNDLRDEIAEYVRLKRQSGTVRFAPGNIFDLSLDSTFDLVLATEVIEHMAHPDRLLKRLVQFVRPGGYILLTTPNGAYFRNRRPRFSDCPDPSVFETAQFKPDADGHIFLVHPEEIETLAVAAGLMVRELRLFGNPLTNGHLKTDQLLRMMPPAWIEQLEHWTRSWPTPLRKRMHTGMAILLQRPSSPANV
jgi:2-polyprenyl-3-methyl-5-hydroxy-6-metoxy-1,4-benzoquinol methylase